MRGARRSPGLGTACRSVNTAVTSFDVPLLSVSTRGIARTATASAATNTTKQRRFPESLRIRPIPCHKAELRLLCPQLN